MHLGDEQNHLCYLCLSYFEVTQDVLKLESTCTSSKESYFCSQVKKTFLWLVTGSFLKLENSKSMEKYWKVTAPFYVYGVFPCLAGE